MIKVALKGGMVMIHKSIMHGHWRNNGVSSLSKREGGYSLLHLASAIPTTSSHNLHSMHSFTVSTQTLKNVLSKTKHLPKLLRDREKQFTTSHDQVCLLP